MGILSFAKNNGLQIPIYGEGSGGDPTAKARTEFSNTRERTGSTAAQRKGLDPAYIPGYGHPAAANALGGDSRMPEAQWANQFIPVYGNHGISNPVAAPLGAPSALGAPANPGAFDHFVPPMNNLVPGQAATASLADHVQVTPNLPINPRATGAESAGQWQAIQQQNANAYKPGGMNLIDPYTTPSAASVAGIAQRYGTPGGVNGVAFVHDPRSFVDASGAQLPNANPQFHPVAGVSPAGAHNDLNGPAQVAKAMAAGAPKVAASPTLIDPYQN